MFFLRLRSKGSFDVLLGPQPRPKKPIKAATSEEASHPSWAAKREEKQKATAAQFQGKRTVFEDDE
jgi:hypothetical protein